jgi:hypothetical protein
LITQKCAGARQQSLRLRKDDPLNFVPAQTASLRHVKDFRRLSSTLPFDRAASAQSSTTGD